jgi:hypothetical protein
VVEICQPVVSLDSVRLAPSRRFPYFRATKQGFQYSTLQGPGFNGSLPFQNSKPPTWILEFGLDSDTEIGLWSLERQLCGYRYPSRCRSRQRPREKKSTVGSRGQAAGASKCCMCLPLEADRRQFCSTFEKLKHRRVAAMALCCISAERGEDAL